MASLTIIYWQNIPAQVIIKNSVKTVKRTLSEKFQKAIDCYRYTVKLAPDNTSAYANLGIAFQQIGSPKEALFHLQNGIKSNPNSIAMHFGLANVYHELADYQSAIHHYKKVIEMAPHYSNAYSNLALSLCRS